MNLRKTLLSLVLVLIAVSAWATSSYDYGANEYVTISGGISPDGKLAITAHGQGEDVNAHFHLYLFDADAGKKIGPLEEITDVLDTGAESYAAKWKKDSSGATVVYRIDRHSPLKAITYRFAKGRAFPTTRQSVDLDDNDPLVRFWGEITNSGRPPERVFGMPKPRS